MCMIRTIWVFRDGSWSKAEDKVDMQMLENNTATAKLETPVVMSITVFETPGDDPEKVIDNDQDEDPCRARIGSSEDILDCLVLVHVVLLPTIPQAFGIKSVRQCPMA